MAPRSPPRYTAAASRRDLPAISARPPLPDHLARMISARSAARPPRQVRAFAVEDDVGAELAAPARNASAPDGEADGTAAAAAATEAAAEEEGDAAAAAAEAGGEDAEGVGKEALAAMRAEEEEMRRVDAEVEAALHAQNELEARGYVRTTLAAEGRWRQTGAAASGAQRVGLP